MNAMFDEAINDLMKGKNWMNTERKYTLSDFQYNPETKNATAIAHFEDGNSCQVLFRNARITKVDVKGLESQQVQLEYDSHEFIGDEEPRNPAM